MIIGYSGEGINDRFTMEALRDKWCPNAKIEIAHYRGSSGGKRKHEVRKACVELRHKGADFILFYTDANGRPFRDVISNEEKWIPDEYRHLCAYAVGDRNVECWLVADKGYATAVTGLTKEQLSGDPKKPLDKYFGSYRDTDKENRIKEYVRKAPHGKWLADSSFDDFYCKCRAFALRENCQNFPNIKG